MDIITLDFETYWNSRDYTLSKMGPIEYIRDPRFNALMVGISINKNAPQVFEHHEIPYILNALELHRTDRMCVGHNINGFDALIISEIYNIHPHWIIDTQTMMRWTGLSRIIAESHAALTKYLGNGEKYAGTVISDGKMRKEDFASHEWERFKQYCADDVSQCRDNFYKMINYMCPDAVKFTSLTARMATEPEFILDEELLTQYIAELDQETVRAMFDLCHLFSFEDRESFLKAVRSPTIFPAMLRQLGVEPPMKFSAKKTETNRKKLEVELGYLAQQGYYPGADWYNKDPMQQRVNELHQILSDPKKYEVYTPAMSKTDLDFLDMQEHPDPRVALLVRTRLENNSSILRSRAVRFKELAKTGKALPIMLAAWRAHTSRYTAGNEGMSDGLNMQNLNKRDKKKQTLRKSIKLPPSKRLVACDSSQIEARMLAHIARQMDLLEQFRLGECPYSILATKIFNPPESWQDIKAGDKAGDPRLSMMRFVGKTGVLSAGYQVGKQKFSNTLLRSGVKLNEDLNKHHELAYHAHYIYRESNPQIVQFWSECQAVLQSLYIGQAGMFGGPGHNTFTFGNNPILNGVEKYPIIECPTGFKLIYPNLRYQANEKGRQEFIYDRQRGRSVIPTKIYGGALCENIIQSISFQLMQWQAVRMWDEDGIRVFGNNHDCFYTIVPHTQADKTLERMEYHMSRVPDWLPGFPVACEGKVGDDFRIA